MGSEQTSALYFEISQTSFRRKVAVSGRGGVEGAVLREPVQKAVWATAAGWNQQSMYGRASRTAQVWDTVSAKTLVLYRGDDAIDVINLTDALISSTDDDEDQRVSLCLPRSPTDSLFVNSISPETLTTFSRRGGVMQLPRIHFNGVAPQSTSQRGNTIHAIARRFESSPARRTQSPAPPPLAPHLPPQLRPSPSIRHQQSG